MNIHGVIDALGLEALEVLADCHEGLAKLIQLKEDISFEDLCGRITIASLTRWRSLINSMQHNISVQPEHLWKRIHFIEHLETDSRVAFPNQLLLDWKDSPVMAFCIAGASETQQR